MPKLPGAVFLTEKVDHRPALAAWLTAKDNPHFARAMANRLWQAMMGRGLVEPVDDFRATNPATHPQLLDRLAEDLIAHDYDFRHHASHHRHQRRVCAQQSPQPRQRQ